jgi:hypothetical protein
MYGSITDTFRGCSSAFYVARRRWTVFWLPAGIRCAVVVVVTDSIIARCVRRLAQSLRFIACETANAGNAETVLKPSRNMLIDFTHIKTT